MQRKLRPAIVAVLPYAAISAIYLAIRIKVLHGMVMVLTPIPWRNVIETWPTMLMFYLDHLVWPVNLSIFYLLPVVTQPGLRNFVLPGDRSGGSCYWTVLLGAWFAARGIQHRSIDCAHYSGPEHPRLRAA